MALVIRLQRTGKPKQAFFRLVAIERARGAHGKPVEILGHYNPRAEKQSEKIVVKKERYEYWLRNGAKPSETVTHLVRGS